MIAFRVGANPVADTESLSGFTRARDRTLADEELYAYWHRLPSVKADVVRGALQLALLLGGQRIAQLLRLTRADVDLSAGFLILRDPKGKRQRPRVHELPITAAAMAILHPLVDRAEALDSDWIFTSEGTRPVYPDTLTAVVRDISAAMKKAKQTRAPFMLSDLRRTAETMMAGMGIGQDLRAQIQSHGLGGVQARHYNRHDYRLEKHKALTAWAAKVLAKPKQAAVIEASTKRRDRNLAGRGAQTGQAANGSGKNRSAA
jgi:integrase